MITIFRYRFLLPIDFFSNTNLNIADIPRRFPMKKFTPRMLRILAQPDKPPVGSPDYDYLFKAARKCKELNNMLLAREWKKENYNDRIARILQMAARPSGDKDAEFCDAEERTNPKFKASLVARGWDSETLGLTFFSFKNRSLTSAQAQAILASKNPIISDPEMMHHEGRLRQLLNSGKMPTWQEPTPYNFVLKLIRHDAAAFRVVKAIWPNFAPKMVITPSGQNKPANVTEMAASAPAAQADDSAPSVPTLKIIQHQPPSALTTIGHFAEVRGLLDLVRDAANQGKEVANPPEGCSLFDLEVLLMRIITGGVVSTEVGNSLAFAKGAITMRGLRPPQSVQS